MRIVFFGTPAFAVPSLRALLDEGAEVVAVVTQPDRPQGRSRSVLVPPPVKELAAAHDIPVLQPDRPRGDLFLAHLRRLAPDLGVVVAYGHILRPEVLSVPPRGMINVHASLLPRHRGAAPVQAAILAGDPESGVTIMQMDAGMDTGDILLARSTPIGIDETAGQLTGRLAALGAQALVEALVLIQRGELHGIPQEHSLATLAPKISREQARIGWDAGAGAVARQVRAFDPVPGAWSTLDGLEVKLFGARAVPGAGPCGAMISTEPELVIGTGDGAVAIAEVQPAGRRRMSAREWCRGRSAGRGEAFA
jgi:methionyl-tRNA formyltransferase